jgi:hypothetical protein
MIGTRLPRNNLDFSTIAPAFFYLLPSMAATCRAVQLGEAVLLNNPVSPYEISEIIGEPRCEG